ncbi:hypothetical protein [Chitinivorax sp. B]|uniref:hypothetical protein n=1 Tax=Chitinivorax sp. B TaxID=2502235 RepID=UPI0010F43F51|nr:hypothetical protein [Chitinivorax sp. B]
MPTPFRHLASLALIASTLFTAAHAEADRPTLARNLLMQLVRHGSSVDAQIITPTLVLPHRMSTRDFLSRLRHTLQDGQGRLTVEVPAPIKNWGSGGGSPWQFQDPQMQLYFKNLFVSIVAGLRNQGYSIQLGKNDLFHGHLFSFEHDSMTDYGILFHAKEYPSDRDIVEQNGGKGADSTFSTLDPAYPQRNLLWIASSSRIWALQATHPSLTPLITADWLDPHSDDPFMQQLHRLQLKALTVQDAYFSDLGTALGSVNFFTRETVKQLIGNQSGHGAIQEWLYF